MKNFSSPSCLLGLCLSAGSLVMASPVHARECKSVHAQIVSAPTTEGCFGELCTAGTIDGNRGLNGTTFFAAKNIVVGPTPSTISYSGRLEITTARGTLTTRDTGIFDPLDGTPNTDGFFSSFGDILHGTGKYSGADGSLFIGGKTVDGQFVTSVITGELCLP